MLRFVEKYAVSIGILLIVFVGSAYALGCRRCGRSTCHGCGFVTAPYVAPAVAASDTNVYVVQSNYPQPLVGAGGSPFYSNGPQGFQAGALPLFDVNQFASQQLQLLRAADQTNALQHERMQAFVTRVTELQAPAVERLAAGNAAAMVLTAAGLNPTAPPANGQSQAVVIDRDEQGLIRIQPMTAEQVQSIRVRVQTQTSGPGATLPAAPPVAGPSEPPPPPVPVGAGLTAQFCGKCHGLDLASPKKGLFLGDDPNVARAMKNRWFEITNSVGNGSMPPSSDPQPTNEQKVAILNELEGFIKKHESSGVER